MAEVEMSFRDFQFALSEAYAQGREDYVRVRNAKELRFPEIERPEHCGKRCSISGKRRNGSYRFKCRVCPASICPLETRRRVYIPRNPDAQVSVDRPLCESCKRPMNANEQGSSTLGVNNYGYWRCRRCRVPMIKKGVGPLKLAR